MRADLTNQSLRLFGEGSLEWDLLPDSDRDRLGLPPQVDDQVFRVLIAKTPASCCFELIVSEQCPKDAYSHIIKALMRLKPRVGIVNITHARSGNAHLALWNHHMSLGPYHMDVDFTHLSELDLEVKDVLHKQTPQRLEDLFGLLEGQNLSNRFFKMLHKHMKRVNCPRENQWHALVDLVLKIIFLIFVQRKGWLNLDPYYLDSKMKSCHGSGLSIVHCFLKPLFARLEGTRIRELVPLGDLPLLGGGLFDFQVESLPVIENEWLIELHRSLCSRFSFSLFEARQGREVVGVGPEMLGHVFENLLIHRDRREHGVYFTPPEIAERQTREAFRSWIKGRGLENDAKGLRNVLPNIRVLDPSCGSGTYLVAAFQVLLELRVSLAPHHERYNGKLFRLKRAIMLENLYGVDIHPMAVRLTEVRLWLNMIQDLEIDRPCKAPALPNLQHHLRTGDFLGRHLPENSAALLRSWPKHHLLEQIRKRFPTSSSRKRGPILKHILRLEDELEMWLDEQSSKSDRNAAKERSMQLDLPGHEGDEADPTMPRLGRGTSPIHVVFSRIMLDGGFDMILGNPPWLSATKISAAQKRRMLQTVRPPQGLSLIGQVDLSLYFMAASLNLLNDKGHLGFLIPGKFLQARFAASFRSWFAQTCRIDYLFDYGVDNRFLFQADTFPLGLGITRHPPRDDHSVLIERRGVDLEERFEISQSRLTAWDVWALLSPRDFADRERTKSWQRLGDLNFAIQRGVVTGAKRHFVFEDKPAQIDPTHLRPLLRGRDLKQNHVAPGRWIYWPFEGGPHWWDGLKQGEQDWLKQTGMTVIRDGRHQLRYGPKPRGQWVLAWKYLAAEFQATLTAEDWVPDQTTYFMTFSDFETAWRLYRYLNSKAAKEALKHIAERGKDRCYFYYAHTCAALPIPPDLFVEPIELPPPKKVFTPAEADITEVESESRCLVS